MKQGLVLGGGGARGAYQLGVWQALRDNKHRFDFISGSSIGAVNGALMVQDDYDLAKALWERITVDDVMVNGVNFEYTIESFREQKHKIRGFVKNYLDCKGADISPYKALLEKSVDPEKILASSVGFGITAASFPSMKPYQVTKEEMGGQIREHLLASSSCFPVFPVCMLGEQKYVDGFYFDDVPVDFAIRQGMDELIVVDLNFGRPVHPEYQNCPFVTYLLPSWPLGGFLAFREENLKHSIRLGYLDASRALGKLEGIRYAFRPGWKRKQREAAAFTHTLTRLNTFVPKKSLLKTLEAFFAPGARTPLMYYTCAAELCAEHFGLDHLEIYKPDQLICALREKAAAFASRERRVLYERLSKKNLLAILESPEKELILAGIYQYLDAPDDRLYRLISHYPVLGICALFLKSITVRK